MNKHILLYSDDPGLGGVAQYNHTLLCGLAALNYQLTYVQSNTDNPLLNAQKELGIEHLLLDFDTTKEWERTIKDGSHAQEIFETAKPDLIIFSDTWPLANSGVKIVAIQMGIPYIIVVGFVAPYPGGLPSEFLYQMLRVYQQAKAVVAVSYENLNLLYELFGLPKNKGQVIYYGRSAKYFAPPQQSVRNRLRQELGIPLNAVLCFTSARLEPVKGYQYQLAAIEELKNTDIWDLLYFVWAGGGKFENELREAVNQLEVADKVKILGQRWDIPDWLDASDIFILPSLSEGMPLAIMEAMAKGLPVIATAVSGIPEELYDTGKLLPDPKINPQATINELVTTIKAWSTNSELRKSIGQACKTRAENAFRDERMIAETNKVIERNLISKWDYVSPDFEIICPDACFPDMIVGNTDNCYWPYLRREIPHNWYVDWREPTTGFLNRDEAHILYNTALKFEGKKALEIGCWLGWSACHLALAGVELDVIDPLLDRQDFYQSVSSSLETAGVLSSVNLIAGYSPQKVEELAKELQRKWSLIFIDGNHDAPAPLYDAMECEKFAEDDALILFHDLSSPDVAHGLHYLRQRGWNVMVYQTMQIMAVAWRGNVEPVMHEPDPQVEWHLPQYLQSYNVSSLLVNSVNYIEQPQQNEIVQSSVIKEADKNVEFSLREFNLIAFPDWQQPEELLYKDLVSVIKSIVTHSENGKITLFLDTSGISDENANFIISDIVFDIVQEEDLDIDEEPEISLLSNLSQKEWDYLLPQLYSRVLLSRENKQAILQAKAENLHVSHVEALIDLKTADFNIITTSSKANLDKGFHIASSLSSKPRIDVVLQASGFHAWSCSYGWINVLQKEGLLNRFFRPIADWNATEPKYDDGLFDYLKNPQADIVLMLSFNWHSQSLHNTAKWREQWHKSPIKKLGIVQECCSSDVVQNSIQWQQQISDAMNNTIPCVDALLCNHEPDVEFLKIKKNLSLPITFFPNAIDPEYLRIKVPFNQRRNRAIFRGNIAQYFTEKTYGERRNIIQALSQCKEVDLFQFTFSLMTNPFEAVQKYTNELNAYTLNLNLPSMSATLTHRPFEIMACGGVLLQNKVIGEISNEFFKDWENAVYYDPENLDDLINKIKYLTENPEIAQNIAAKGHQLCYEQHTLSNRITSILDWLGYRYGVKTNITQIVTFP